MLVIFEGVDGSGKTTAIKQLKEKFGWKEIEWPGKQKDSAAFLQMAYKFTNEHAAEIESPQVYLMDRGGLGEIVYGTLQNRLDTIDGYVNFYKFLKEKCLFVFCENPNAHERAIKRGEDGIAKDPFVHKVVANTYSNIGIYFNSFWYNYEEDEVEDIAAAIVDALFRKIIEKGQQEK